MELKDSDIFALVAIGSIDEVTRFLTNGTDINVVNASGASLLHFAAFNGRIDMVDLLINGGINTNIATSDTGQIALHWAANSVPTLHALIQHGCAVSTRDHSGKTVAHIAAEHSAVEVLHYLERAGLLPSEGDHRGHHPLHWAVLAANVNALRYLSALHDLNAVSHAGLTPLHLAAGLGKTEAVHYLSDQHACSLTELDGKQRMPLDVARENNQHAAVSALRRAMLLRQLGAVFGRKAQSIGWLVLPLLVPVLAYLLVSAQWLLLCAVLSVFVATQLVGVLPYFFVRTEYFICGCACALWCYVVLPHSLFYALEPVTHASLIALRLLIALLYLRCALSDPSAGTADEPHVIDARKVCPTCRTKIPLRTKHCRVTNKCVARFDHYCAWIANSVGAHNHVPFVGFLVAVMLNNVISMAISGTGLLALHGRTMSLYEFALTAASWGHLFLLVVNAAMLVWLAVLAKGQLHGVLYNITFNEQLNWRRYSHLQRDGKFNNPFDLRSKSKNISEFLFSVTRSNNLEDELPTCGKH